VERKVATVLFVDLVDSTGLVAQADPEVVRQRVNRYFAQVSHCIETHGGTVEKFAGDAVMAAFGVPIAHEDDAERALRAALAIVPEVEALGLAVRVGVESGEVVVEDAQSTFATGEAVNLAARLQQAAQPGEILLGPAARRLAARAVEVENAGPVEIRGRAEPVWAWRVLRVHDPHRVVSAPFVGRDGELELLENSLTRAVRDRRVQLVTLYGEPGLGKTRLVAEFVESLERVTALSGRTLPYGEGVTYWPLASMIKASAGITDDDPANNAFEKLRLCCESEAVADLLAVALGVLGAAEGERTPEQLTWAALRWAEQLADVQPLVLVFEDVHWAEEPLLELIEHLARSLRSAPVLIIAVARPELLDTRPSWGGGIRGASAIELVPLDARESEELADALMSESDVPPAQRALVLERAEGNPLFLEEIARVLGDDREALDRIPDTVQALIAARIDLLEPEEKRVLQSAALIGRVFWRGALDRLASDLDVGCMLDGLLAREFIVPEERSTISGDRAFRFKHVLIRDVAYSGISKAQRAEQHQVFAQWVDERAHDEFAEIRAHHLDEAAQLLDELDGTVPADLAREAAAAADEAGRRALRRGAFVVARRMLLRATELEPTAARRYLAAHAAWRLSDVPSVRDEAEGALADARAEGLPDVEGRALVLLAELALHADSDVARAHDLADEALAILPLDELAGLYDAHSLLGTIFWWRGDAEGARRHGEATLELAHEAGRPELESLALTQLAGVEGVQGHAAESLELLERATELAEKSGSREATAFALAVRGRRAVEGGLEQAEDDLRTALEIFGETGAAGRHGWAQANLGEIYRLRGELTAAERTLRDAVRRLRTTHEQGYLAEAERQLAEVLVKQGKLSEAERLVAEAQRRVGRGDVWTRASILHALGVVRAAQGRTDEAEAAFADALAIIEPTMYVILARDVRASLESLRSRATAPAQP
jgi:class 3 adenylate cyclase/ATP/maltotriose-dependent transcriptional regulator MalT